MLKSWVAATLFMTITASSGSGEAPWELRKNENGIQVYTRKVESSPILEYKAQMTLNQPLEKVLEFYEQEARMVEWFHNCTESKILEQKSPNEKILYFVISMPWPVSDRDSVYKRVKSVDGKTGAVSYQISAMPDAYPKQDGKVRVPYVKTTWRFTPVDGKTEVYYQQHSDAGGSLPTSLVNKLAVSIPFKTFTGLRKMIESEK